MLRKDFFKGIVLGGMGIFILPQNLPAAPAVRKIILGTEFITGFQYYDGPDIEHLLQTGMSMTLNREPHNKYDQNAIQILCGEAKLGYVPRNANKTIARLMDQGIKVYGIIKELSPADFPYGSVKLEIYYFNPVEKQQ